jgi:AmiR/NasT family two-component response regulator
VRVLVAEDETIIRLDVRAILERAGHDVVGEARDGEEAIALARELDPDLIVMDVRMPHVDGVEAARRIVEERPVPIVMLTAYAEGDLVQRAAEAGAFGYLVKPFREVDLVPAIDTARARFDELVELRAEAASLQEALATRKAVERAKGLLMRREGIGEQEAFAMIRGASQKSGRSMGVVAEALLATFDESGAEGGS